MIPGDEQWDESWEEDDVHPDDDAEGPEESQLREAYAIQDEAARTLKEAKEAVRQVRSRVIKRQGHAEVRQSLFELNVQGKRKVFLGSRRGSRKVLDLVLFVAEMATAINNALTDLPRERRRVLDPKARPEKGRARFISWTSTCR